MEVGTDLDGDGELDPNEVTASSIECEDRPSCDAVLEGNFTIENSLDVQTLEDFCEVTGNLYIDLHGEVVLPTLLHVGGNVEGSGLAAVRLPILWSAGGIIIHHAEVLEAPALYRVGGVLTESDIAELSLPRVTVAARVWVNTFELPRLRWADEVTMRGVAPAGGLLSLPELRASSLLELNLLNEDAVEVSIPNWTGERLAVRGHLSSLVTPRTLERFTTVQSGPSTVLVNGLREAETVIVYSNHRDAGFVFPDLEHLVGPEWVGKFDYSGLVIESNTTAGDWGPEFVSLPNVTTITGGIESASVKIRELDLPRLRELDALHLTANWALHTLRVPELESVSTLLFLQSAHALTDLDFPSLVEVGCLEVKYCN